MQTEELVCPRLAIVATCRSASAAEDDALSSAGLVQPSADGWLSLTPKGRALLLAHGYTFTSPHGWVATGAAQRPFHYVRTHTPTGNLYVCNFNASHHPMWGGDEWRYCSMKSLEAISCKLIDKWNKASPENTIWSYRLALGPALDPQP